MMNGKYVTIHIIMNVYHVNLKKNIFISFNATIVVRLIQNIYLSIVFIIILINLDLEKNG